MKFGYVLPSYPLDVIYENAVLAEKSGFDSIWMMDHTVAIGIKNWNFLEAWSILAGLSMKTKNVTLGACVSDPHRRHPAILAQTVTTLDIMSEGRAVLGIGAGEAMNLDPYGIAWSKPVSRMYEAIEVIKKLWTEEKTDYDGDFFSLKEAFLSPRPFQKPHPPIWVAANSPRTMKIVAELADGWIPTCALVTPEIYKKNLQEVEKWAKEAGRDPSQIEPAIFLCTVATEDRGTAWKFTEFPAKILLCLSPRLLNNHGVKSIPKELHWSQFVSNRKTTQLLLQAVNQIPREAIEKTFVFGTANDCIDKLEKFKEAGVRHFLLNIFVPPKLSKSMLQYYASKVVSYFQSEKED